MTHSQAMATLRAAWPNAEAIFVDERMAWHNCNLGQSMYTRFEISISPGLDRRRWSFWSAKTLEQAVADCLADLPAPDPDPGDTAEFEIEPVRVRVAY